MPARQKVSKETLLEKAYEIAVDEGINKVTSRSVAKKVGVSIQPVFSHFPTMKILRSETFNFALEKFKSDILKIEKNDELLDNITLYVLNIARNKPNLYKLLYLSDEQQRHSIYDVTMCYESNVIIFEMIKEDSGLEDRELKDILTRCFVMFIGITTMICVNHVNISDDEVLSLLNKTLDDLIKEAKNKN